MDMHYIVARFKDGSLLRGNTSDFSPFRTSFHLELENAEEISVDMERLKAVFFVKDSPEVDEQIERYKNIKDMGGKKVKVHFVDGELISGYALEYSSDHHGFFLTPDDHASNNERIFVITAATEKITFL
jgi:hypothetical protein